MSTFLCLNSDFLKKAKKNLGLLISLCVCFPCVYSALKLFSCVISGKILDETESKTQLLPWRFMELIKQELFLKPNKISVRFQSESVSFDFGEREKYISSEQKKIQRQDKRVRMRDKS